MSLIVCRAERGSGASVTPSGCLWSVGMSPCYSSTLVQVLHRPSDTSEDLYPGPLPPSPRPGTRPSPRNAGRARLPPRRRAGLPGGLGRAPRPGDRPLRGHHRDRIVLPTAHPGDDRPALRPRGPGVLDRGQRLLAPRSSLDRPDAPRLAERPPDPPTPARFLAGPGRDLLLRR